MNNSVGDKNYINLLKGLTVFFVLWGHSIQYTSMGSDFFTNPVFKFIYSFHMPLFMMISGYLFWSSFKKRNLDDLLKHRTRTLLQPIFMCGILATVLTTWFYEVCNNGINSLIKLPIHGIGIGVIERYWFLWSVLACSSVIAIVFKIKGKVLRVVATLFGIFLLGLFPHTLYSMFLYPYFIIGFLLAREQNRVNIFLEKKMFAVITSTILFSILLLLYKKEHYIYISGLYSHDLGALKSLEIDFFRWAIGLFGCFSIAGLAKCIYLFLEQNGKGRAIIIFFEKLGERSLQLYCLQSIILEGWFAKIYGKCTELLGYNPLSKNIILYNCVYTPLIAFVFSFGILKIVKLLEKWKVSKILFGR